MSSYYEWTTGSVYYAALVVSEVFGSTGTAQIVDLGADSYNEFHPAYAIYENGAPVRLALFNYVSDATGANDYSVTVSFDSGALPNGTVQVRYLRADSVSEKYNITWAEQTMGNSFECDGTLKGNVSTVSIACDTTANTCTIPVYAPSVALVFLTQAAVDEVSPPAAATSFATSVIAVGTATVNAGSLATGNGQMGSGSNTTTGSTSSGSISAGEKGVTGQMRGILAGVMLGMLGLGMGLAMR